jgi:hypothetical protein
MIGKYHGIKLASDEVALKSSNASFEKIIKKSNVLSIEEEHKMLNMKCICLLPHLAST